MATFLWNKDARQLADALAPGENYIVAGSDGLYDIRVGEIGTFIAQAKRPVAHLETIKEGVVLNLPKAPYRLLEEAINHFYKQANCFGHEAQYQIFFDRERKEYFGHIPKQEASSVHIFTKRSVELEMRHLFVVDLHSHLTSTACFSSTDDENEMEDERFYGVVAIARFVPDIAMRFCCGGNYVSIAPDKVFETRYTEGPRAV